MNLHLAPELITSDWINTPKPLSLASFRGRILVVEAFQMLCPGCVAHGLPQLQRVAEAFPRDQVATIGLHTVFEHHEAQGSRAALVAFAHEYRLKFPIGIDQQTASGLPATMMAYQMRGTPTMLIIDRDGVLRVQEFGMVEDLKLGSILATLIAEQRREPSALNVSASNAIEGEACTDAGCPIPLGA